MSEEINENLDTSESIERDKLLLDLILRNYDEEERRNELIDSKNSQMIVLTGTMLTLQATLFSTVLLNDFVYNNIGYSIKLWVFVLFICSLIVSLISMILFIFAYKFVGDFHQAPTANYVRNTYSKNKNSSEIIDKIFSRLPKTINKNKKLMTRKVNIANIGFCCLIINIILILSFVFLLIFSIIL